MFTRWSIHFLLLDFFYFYVKHNSKDSNFEKSRATVLKHICQKCSYFYVLLLVVIVKNNFRDAATVAT